MEQLILMILSAVTTGGLIVAGLVWREKRNGGSRPSPVISEEQLKRLLREVEMVVMKKIVEHTASCPNMAAIDKRLEHIEGMMERHLQFHAEGQ